MNGPIEYIRPPQGAVCSICQVEGTWWEHLIEFPDLDSARVRPARTQAVYPTDYTMLSLEPPRAYYCADCGRREKTNKQDMRCPECDSKHYNFLTMDLDPNDLDQAVQVSCQNCYYQGSISKFVPPRYQLATCQVCLSSEVVWRIWRNGWFDWFCENHTHDQIYEDLETGEYKTPREMS